MSKIEHDPKAVAQLRELHVGGSIDDWRSVGFAGQTVVRIGSTRLHPTGRDVAIGHAVLEGVTELDGLALGSSSTPSIAEPMEHPNGVVAIDHVVVRTPDASRTQTAFEAAGIETRRIRRFETDKGEYRQAFHWLGDALCEVAGPEQASGEGPSTWWGLALTVADIDATAAYLGDRATTVKDAVQPGRRVTTLRSTAGLAMPILFISEHVSAAGR